jgi:hypothetical protein
VERIITIIGFVSKQISNISLVIQHRLLIMLLRHSAEQKDIQNNFDTNKDINEECEVVYFSWYSKTVQRSSALKNAVQQKASHHAPAKHEPPNGPSFDARIDSSALRIAVQFVYCRT